MRNFSVALTICILFTACARSTYYITRHAEKAAPGMGGSTDVPLTPNGEQHAQALAQFLKNKDVVQVWSTAFVRTQATARPTADMHHLPIRSYASGSTAVLDSVRNIKKGAVLIIGHSNTVDDLVNGLMQKHMLQDLPDSQYGDLFIVTKKGGKLLFRQCELYPIRSRGNCRIPLPAKTDKS